MASIRRIKEAAAFQVGLSKSSDGIDSPDLYGCGGGPHESHACVESSQTYIKKGYRSYKRHPEYNFRLHGFLLPRKMRHLLVRLDIRKIRFNSVTFLPKKKMSNRPAGASSILTPLGSFSLYSGPFIYVFPDSSLSERYLWEISTYEVLPCSRDMLP